MLFSSRNCKKQSPPRTPVLNLNPRNEKRIIVTICAGESVKKMAEVTMPLMQKLAENWEVEFGVITEEDVVGLPHPSCGKVRLWKWLNKGYRALSLDLDTLVDPNMPNLFDKVEEGHLGIVERGKYWKKGTPQYSPKIMENYIREYNKQFPRQKLPALNKYDGRYYNAGVFVTDATCFPFDDGDIPIIKVPFEHIEQTLFNVLIQVKKIPVCELPWQFNAIGGMLGYEGNESYLLREAYIRHYTTMKEKLFTDVNKWRRLKNA